MLLLATRQAKLFQAADFSDGLLIVTMLARRRRQRKFNPLPYRVVHTER